MPILNQEIDLFPANLLDGYAAANGEGDVGWWAVYTCSRREKQLMRRLLKMEISFYGPTCRRRYRSPAGRVRESFQPLFPNYVFLFGSEEDRVAALTTNCVSKCTAVADAERLVRDLRQIRQLIDIGAPLTPEARLEAGDHVRVKTGMFAGFEGFVIRRENETRLLVTVNFMQQGASFKLDDCQLEKLR